MRVEWGAEQKREGPPRHIGKIEDHNLLLWLSVENGSIEKGN